MKLENKKMLPISLESCIQDVRPATTQIIIYVVVPNS